jgi:hypothetical protein
MNTVISHATVGRNGRIAGRVPAWAGATLSCRDVNRA